MRPLALIPLLLLLAACEPAYHVVELDLSPGDRALVEALGGDAPILMVVNEGPGRIEVLFEPGSAAAYGPYSIQASSVTSWPVPETRLVEIVASADEPTLVRVRAVRAGGIAQVGATALDPTAVTTEQQAADETLSTMPEQEVYDEAAPDPDNPRPRR